MPERRLVSSGSRFEREYGYSRAVAVGDRILVAGTAPIMADGSVPPADTGAQTRRCYEIVERALADARASLRDVVRTRVFLTPAADWEAAARVHGELFAEIRPVNTTLFVAALVDPAWHIEVEVEAVR